MSFRGAGRLFFETTVMNEDLGTAATRPSAPRGAGTIAVESPLQGSTTLPLIHWSETGVQLEPSALPRYERLDLLGSGGMGEVVRARDNDIGRDVAVKRLKAGLTHPELYARFVEEVRTIGKLDHPNIVPIHDAGLDAQGYFFVMKHVEGESLASIIRRLDEGDAEAHARWPFERRVDVIRKVLEALRYAHAKGVLHRDIKPANILVGPLGEVFLLDWGIAKRERGAPDSATPAPAPGAPRPLETTAGAVMGTPLYMSPEQARGETADERSDLYSLCLVFYELLTLRHPFAHLADDAAKLLAAVAKAKIPHAATRRHPEQIQPPMDLGWLLQKGLAKDPAQRYQTADELIRRLDDRAEGKVPIQCHVTAAKRTSYEAMRLISRFPALFFLVLAAAAAAGLWQLFR